MLAENGNHISTDSCETKKPISALKGQIVDISESIPAPFAKRDAHWWLVGVFGPMGVSLVVVSVFIGRGRSCLVFLWILSATMFRIYPQYAIASVVAELNRPNIEICSVGNSR
jgi:hypothetical protein